jgi:hypothetical protein
VIIGNGAQSYQLQVPVTGGVPNHFIIDPFTLQPGQTTGFDYDAATGNVIVGDSLAGANTTVNGDDVDVGNPLTAGNIYLNKTTTVTSSGSRPAPSGITLTPTSATASNIGQAVAAGGSLVLGSSIASPDTLTVADAAGSGTVAVGGNAGSSIVMTGGVGASQTSIITTSATGVGSLLLGASAANDRAIFINDTAGAADTAVVDITKGTADGIALRLQGYGAAGTAATVSTNSGTGQLNISSGPADVAPALQIVPANITVNRQMISSGSWVPVQLRAAQVTGPNVTFDVDCSPLPSGFAMVYGTSGNPTAGDQGGFFSVMIYTGPGNVIQGGGVGGVPSIVTVQPSPASNTSLRIAMVLQTSANYSIFGITLLGG